MVNAQWRDNFISRLKVTDNWLSEDAKLMGEILLFFQSLFESLQHRRPNTKEGIFKCIDSMD